MGTPKEAVFSFLRIGHSNEVWSNSSWLSAHLTDALIRNGENSITADDDQQRLWKGDLETSRRKLPSFMLSSVPGSFEHKNAESKVDSFPDDRDMLSNHFDMDHIKRRPNNLTIDAGVNNNLASSSSDASLDITRLTVTSSDDKHCLVSTSRGRSYTDKLDKQNNGIDYTWEYILTSKREADIVSGGSFVVSSQNTCKKMGLMGINCPEAKLTMQRLPITTFVDYTPASTGMTASNKSSKSKSGKKESHLKKKRQSHRVRVLKQLLSGAFAGVVSRTAVAPLDLIRTFQITSHGLGATETSALAICKEIIKHDGWRGLFRGNFVNCIRVAPSKAVELYVFETVRRALNKADNPLKNAAAILAGGAAGMAGTVATYPLELIRTRISVQPELYSGLLQTIRKIATDEGFFAFYSGLTPSLVGVFPYAGTNYFVYDALRTTYCHHTKQKNVPTLLTLSFGAVSAAASSAVTYPLEVARRQMQLCLRDTLVKKSTLKVLLDIYQQEGFLALYRGLGTTWLKLIPAAGISFVCYETARLALHIDDASTTMIEETALDVEKDIET